MTKNSRITVAIILLSVGFLLCSVYSFRQYRSSAAQEQQYRVLQHELQTADAIADDPAAIIAYKKLTPSLPEIQLRILQRQWRSALSLVQSLQRIRYHGELQNETVASSARLKSHLTEMLDQCSTMLVDAASLRADILWQVYNASGAAKLMNAFLMLDDQQSADKVQGVIRDALTDFKAAIEAADRAGISPLQRNIPRWNFELLNGEQYIKKIEAARTDMEKNQALKENLETLIPEMGGYAPGEPIETKIKK
jgi:hypothetical protein